MVIDTYHMTVAIITTATTILEIYIILSTVKCLVLVKF